MRPLPDFANFALAVLGITIASITAAWAPPTPDPTAVPEPISAPVFGAGLVGVALIRGRMKK
jgi:hypothetical protein